MIVVTNTSTKKSTPSNGQAFELDDGELDMVVGGINPQPLPPRSPKM